MVTRLPRPLSSVLQVPSDNIHAIQRLHKSFPDFLTDPNRYKNPTFHIATLIRPDEKIAFRCLQLMKRSPKKKFAQFLPIRRIKMLKTSVFDKRSLLDALEYVCRFWTHHVSLASKTGVDIGPTLDLLKTFLSVEFYSELRYLVPLGTSGLQFILYDVCKKLPNVSTFQLEKLN
jgi:hypothetical protein